MRSIWLILLQSTLIASAVGQSAPQPAPLPELPKDPQAIFAAAAPLYDFSAPTLKPWHMKVSYQLYDVESKPTEQGTFEYWWESPKNHRSTMMRSGMEQTYWIVDGVTYKKSSGTDPGYFERSLFQDLMPPLTVYARRETNKPTFELVEDKKIEGMVCVRMITSPVPQLSPSSSPRAALPFIASIRTIPCCWHNCTPGNPR
jgi:hypothetical protein